MDDSACRRFFTQPSRTYHRQYEALRAVFVDDRKQKEVAEEFGFTYGTMRQLVFGFRQLIDGQAEPAESPFFETLLRAIAPSTPAPAMNRPLRSLPIVGK